MYYIQKQYRWKHLIYNDLIICLVSITEEGMLPVMKIVPPLPANILHHRLDLMLQTVVDKDILCVYRNKIVTLCKKIKYLFQLLLFIKFINILKLILFSFLFFSNGCNLFITMVLPIPNGATEIIGNGFSRERTKLHGIYKRCNGSFS